MKSYIKLQESSVLHVPILSYDNDFTFIINKEKFRTNRLVADLLSPKISKYHQIDPTIQEYSINTISKGNFSTILKLLKFEEEEINDDEIPFIIEILTELENTSNNIEMRIGDNKCNEETENNSHSFSEKVQKLSKNIKYWHFFEKEIQKEIEEISSKMYEMKETDKNIIKTFDFEIITSIISNPKLCIESEDKLIEFINEIYLNDIKYCQLYSYVYFTNVSVEKMNEFIQIIDYNDITNETWRSITKRLCKEIIKSNENNDDNYNELNIKTRYRSEKRRSNQIFSYSNNAFDGIINHFNNNSNIKNEINVSYSSKCTNNDCSDIWSIFNYDGQQHHFYTSDKDECWISIEFKNHQIKPTSYTIKSGFDSFNPRSFTFEGSNDNKKWIIIDEVKESNYFEDPLSFHTFHIQAEKQQPFKYFRLFNKGLNWGNTTLLQISSIEIFGEIF